MPRKLWGKTKVLFLLFGTVIRMLMSFVSLKQQQHHHRVFVVAWYSKAVGRSKIQQRHYKSLGSSVVRFVDQSTATTTTTTSKSKCYRNPPLCFSTTRNTWSDSNNAAILPPSSTSTSASRFSFSDVAESRIYQELITLSQEILRHDDLYYNQQPILADDEYDALVQREQELSDAYPHLLQRWQTESGRGIQATRQGRVGAILPTTTTTTTTTTTDKVPLEEQQQSPKQRDGDRREKRQHLQPMLSLENVNTQTQLLAWLHRIQRKLIAKDDDNIYTTTTNKSPWKSITILTEPKLDGVSLSLRYQRETDSVGRYSLIWASTRGDGYQGQDVTNTVRRALTPHVIPTILSMDFPTEPTTGVSELTSSTGSSGVTTLTTISSSSISGDAGSCIEVRGEIILPRSVFHQWQQQRRQDYQQVDASNSNTAITSTIFSNARNAASGILLRKTITTKDDQGQIVEHQEENKESFYLQSKLLFYAYQLITDKHSNITTGLQARQQLQEWGFQVPEPIAVTHLDLLWNHTSSLANESQTQLLWTERNLSSLLEYYNQLEQHRREQQGKDSAYSFGINDYEIQSNSKAEQTKEEDSSLLSSSSSSLVYHWGDYDMDGCVHKLDDYSLRQLMGASAKSPRWAVAHKFPPRTAMTRILQIDIQVGRTGALTPVAILEPVDIGGVTVQRATLHNFGHMKHILGRGGEEAGGGGGGGEGSKTVTDTNIPVDTLVLVRRAGDVIPQVVQRLNVTNPTFETGTMPALISLEPPSCCPACGSPTVFDDDGNNSSIGGNIGRVLRCGGPPLLCPPRAVTSLVHAFSRDALDVKGLSEARIQQLLDAKFLAIPSDVFEWTEERWERIAELPGWGKKSCANLKAAAKAIATNGIDLSRFIFSLGIRQVGKHSSQLLASAFGNVGSFLDAMDHSARWNPIICPNEDDGIPPIRLSGQLKEVDCSDPNGPFGMLRDDKVKGIGPVLISSLIAFSKEPELVKAARKLSDSIVVLEEESFLEQTAGRSAGLSLSNNVDRADLPWKGFKVVFSGTINKLSRPEAQELARRFLGAAGTPNTVSKATDLVVYGEKGGKKLEKATEMGIETMAADEFLSLLDAWMKEEKR